jgi:ribulose-phosphate 3-epimerase
MPTIIPAILTKDISDLKQKLAVLAPWAPAVHIDISDGKFVANKTLSYGEMAPILASSPLPIELHLMVAKPWPIVREAAAAKVARVFVHAETITDSNEFVGHQQATQFVGLVFNLETPWGIWEKHLADVPSVLLMAIEPGWQGSEFQPKVLDRLAFLRSHYPAVEREVDGGVDRSTIQQLVAAGATRVVVGSALWQSADPHIAYEQLCALITEQPKNLIT